MYVDVHFTTSLADDGEEKWTYFVSKAFLAEVKIVSYLSFTKGGNKQIGINER